MFESIHVDFSYLKDISMDDDALIIEMIDLFLDNAPTMIANIETYCNQELWEKMASEIHRFKPNLDYMGMTTTKVLIEQLETDALKNRNTEEFAERLQTVKKRCSEAYTLLEKERVRLKD